ncbi:ankyrin repeat domain-containing protein [Streptomyces sp. NPDC014894]|uniref:ankyrin repeat domain-containing protein n=1 Tax=unclassified Streptomyces TaxID=2593676 RepID=UPI0036FFACED
MTSGAGRLFEAVYGADEDAVVRLLRSGVPAEAVDEDGESVLHRAAVDGRTGIVRLLLAAGADPDRACGDGSFEGGDLPLCGAAAHGHERTVRALLAAGARPDLREAFDRTALVWAVRYGHPGTVRALLESGADPALPDGEGVTPRTLAVRQGSSPVVRALLESGAGTAERLALLAEARAWLGRDVERELRAGLTAAYGEGLELTARRIVEDGGVTVVVGAVRDGAPGPAAERRTGHAAIVTMLEAGLGIRTPCAELAERALRGGPRGVDNWREQVLTLGGRADEETLIAAEAWCADADPRRQAFGADVLGRPGPPGPLAARAVAALRALSRRARDAEPVLAAVAGLGLRGDPSALPEIARHAGHPDPAVRRQVAESLPGAVATEPEAPPVAVAALIALCRDRAASVRDRAAHGLAGLRADTPALRDTLAGLLDAPDGGRPVADAALGLALRQDPRAEAALLRLLEEADPDPYALTTAREATALIHDAAIRRRLEGATPRR